MPNAILISDVGRPVYKKYPRNMDNSDATNKKEGKFLVATQSPGQDSVLNWPHPCVLCKFEVAILLIQCHSSFPCEKGISKQADTTCVAWCHADPNSSIFAVMDSLDRSPFSSFDQKFYLTCSEPAEVVVTAVGTFPLNFLRQ